MTQNKVFTYSLVCQYVKELGPSEKLEMRDERYDYLYCSLSYLFPLDWVENNGFEPLTLCLQSRCSSQLS